MSIRASRKIHPDSYRDHLRSEFLRHLTQTNQFRKAVRDLGPFWSLVVSNTRNPDAIVKAHYSQLQPGVSVHLAAYKTALEMSVTKELRCHKDGNAPDWICQAVHSHVIDEPIPIPIALDPRMHLGELRLIVPNGGPPALVRKIDGQQYMDIRHLDPEPNEFLYSATATYTNWEELRRVAHAMLDDLLDGVRQAVEDDTQDWRQIRRGGHETRVEETMPVLVAWLTNDVPLRGSDRTFGYNLLRDLELDRPQRRTRVKKRRQK